MDQLRASLETIYNMSYSDLECVNDLRAVQSVGSRLMKSDFTATLFFPAQKNSKGIQVSPYLRFNKRVCLTRFVIGLMEFKNGVMETYKEETDARDFQAVLSNDRENLAIVGVGLSNIPQAEGISLDDFFQALRKYSVMRPPAPAGQGRPDRELVNLASAIVSTTGACLVDSSSVQNDWEPHSGMVTLVIPTDAPISEAYGKGDGRLLDGQVISALASSFAGELSQVAERLWEADGVQSVYIRFHTISRGHLVILSLSPQEPCPVPSSFLPVTASHAAWPFEI